MDFKLVSDDSKRVHINMELINIYTGRYKAGTPFDFSCTRRQKKKSDPLRRYYFAAVLPPFMKDLGYEKDEDILFHHQLKVTYFKGTHNIYQDERGMWRNVPSVFSNESDLDISIKKGFTDWVIRKAAHYDVYIPDPGE